MSLHLPVCALTLVSLSLGQAPVSTSPKAAAAQLGTTSNAIPFGWFPTVYQQVHGRGSFSDPSPAVLTQLRFRMGTGSANTSGANIEVELFMAESPNDAAGASTVFANNVVGTERNVFTRKWATLPRVSDNSWAVAPFFLDVPFAWNGTHLSWRSVVHANSVGNQGFNYPLDAWTGSSPSTSVAIGTGCKADNGASLALHTVTGHAVGANAQYVGRSFVAAGGLPALLVIGTSKTSLDGVQLPFDLTWAGAPRCSLYNSWNLVVPGVTTAGTTGTVTTTIPIPNVEAFAGSTHYSQYVFVSPGANALGAFTSNGAANALGGPVGVTRIYANSNPAATSGIRDLQYGLAIGLN